MENEFKNFEIKNYKPLGEVVFEYLRNAILNGTLKPGERLMEISLADQLGVSRTPVREAIRKLEKEKFVEMIPRKGAYVANLTARDILEVLEIRIVLEGFASKLAAERMGDDDVAELESILAEFNKALEVLDRPEMIRRDNEFHNKIYSAAKNNKLVEIVKELHDQYQRFRLIFFNEYDDYNDLQVWHQNIVDAIRNRDGNRAKECAEYHVRSIRESVIKWEDSQSGD
jgi:DNA-binding GntR family transcriptional regulator